MRLTGLVRAPQYNGTRGMVDMVPQATAKEANCCTVRVESKDKRKEPMYLNVKVCNIEKYFPEDNPVVVSLPEDQGSSGGWGEAAVAGTTTGPVGADFIDNTNLHSGTETATTGPGDDNHRASAWP